jgi:hypothetical protein
VDWNTSWTALLTTRRAGKGEIEVRPACGEHVDGP